MLRTLRQHYWVICVRDSIKACIRSCISCVRERAAIPIQLMGNLSSVRVTPARPFKVASGQTKAMGSDVVVQITTRKDTITLYCEEREL